MEPVRPRRGAFAGLIAATLCFGAGPVRSEAPFEALYREAYNRRLQEFGPKHPDTVESLVRLGALLAAHGRAEGAEPVLRQALKVQDATGPAGSATLLELADALSAIGRNSEAMELYGRSLKLAPSGPEGAMTLLKIARLREMGGDDDGARQAYVEALERFETVTQLSVDELRARATAMNGLGLLLEAEGDLPAAEEAYRNSASAHVLAFGVGHPATAAARANLANAVALRGEAANAAALLEQSLAVMRVAVGPRHEDAARLLNRLGEICETLGRFDEAQEHYLDALAAWRDPSPSRGLVLADLGRLSGVRGDPAAAQQSLAEAVRLLEAAGDAFAIDLAEALYSYGSALRALGRLDDSESILSRALSIRERSLGGSHPDVALTLVGLGGVLHLQGELARAGPLYRRALEIQERTLGLEHAEVGETLYNLAHLQRAIGDSDGARESFQRSARILSVAYGPDDPFVGEIRAVLRSLR